MESPPLPAFDAVLNSEAVVTIFGQFNLYNGELRAIRLMLAEGMPCLEADFYVPGEFAVRIAAGQRAPEYGITLRCTDIAGLGLADFDHQNIVGEYAFEVVADAPDGRGVRVAVTGSPGCDIELRCRSVAVVGVGFVPPAGGA
jgi:hypothetical protein